jgi:hypothetical protein
VKTALALLTRLTALLLLLPSLAAAQFTTAQVNGLVQSIELAVAGVTPQTPPTFPTATRAEFGIKVTAAHIAAGAIAIRCTIHLTPEQGDFLSIPRSYFTGPSKYYMVMQVVGVPTATPYAMPPWLTDLLDTCSKTPITPVVGWSQVILAAAEDPVAQSVATGFACACRKATGTCNWTPPLVGGGVGAATAAPFGMTLPAGLWSGAGCRLTPCLGLYGYEPYPTDVCPLQ